MNTTKRKPRTPYTVEETTFIAEQRAQGLTWEIIANKVNEKFNTDRNIAAMQQHYSKCIHNKPEDFFQKKVEARPVIYWSNTEKYILLKGIEDGKSRKNISKALEQATGILRSKDAISYHYTKVLKDKSSKEFEAYIAPTSEVPVAIELDAQAVIPFKNENSELKQHTRELLVNQILDETLTDMRVLSLPADNFIFEKELQARFIKFNPEKSIDFLCVEHNEEVYSHGLGEAMVNNFNYIKTKMEDILPKLSNPFNAIWLDFCCMYNDSVIKSLQTISSNNLLADGGVLGLTLMYGREPNINQLIAFLKPGELQTNDTLRFKALPRYICEIIFHGKVKLSKILKYHDQGENVGSAPMLLYIFQKTEVAVKKAGIIELNYKSL